MDRLWISAMTGALTGGFTSCTCVVLFGMPLWSILIIYPLVGLFTTGVIYGVWRYLEGSNTEDSDAVADNLFQADALIK